MIGFEDWPLAVEIQKIFGRFIAFLCLAYLTLPLKHKSDIGSLILVLSRLKGGSRRHIWRSCWKRNIWQPLKFQRNFFCERTFWLLIFSKRLKARSQKYIRGIRILGHMDWHYAELKGPFVWQLDGYVICRGYLQWKCSLHLVINVASTNILGKFFVYGLHMASKG